jgi:hypothetical protein
MSGHGNSLDCAGISVPRNEGCIEPGCRTIDAPLGSSSHSEGQHKLNTVDLPASGRKQNC